MPFARPEKKQRSKANQQPVTSTDLTNQITTNDATQVF